MPRPPPCFFEIHDHQRTEPVKPTFQVAITKRIRRRTNTAGKAVSQTRFVVNYRDPKTQRRIQLFFERRTDAEAARNEIVATVERGGGTDRRAAPTVREAAAHWLTNRETSVKASTMLGYRIVVDAINGPLLTGTPQERATYSRTGSKPKGAMLLPMLGDVSTLDLETAQIRAWHTVLREEVGLYTANRAKSVLKSILALAEEDFRVRAPSMPTLTGRRASKPKKAILAPEQITQLLAAAREDKLRGAYYAFPFLTGTRISEQLGLLWDEVDFDAGVIRIRRILERDGTLSETTKTDAGRRDIAMMPMLRDMLREWRVACPRTDGKLYRVFPAPGRPCSLSGRRIGAGGPFIYQNFRSRIWEPIFKELDLPYVSPHSARHSFISMLQERGVPVGLVAKLAGHSNATVTLGHYTQAIGGGEAAVAALQGAYDGR
jgi:integrase